MSRKTLVPILSAITLLAATPATSQNRTPSPWTLEQGLTGCVVHAGRGSDTVISVFGFTDHDALVISVQGKAWTGVESNSVYPVRIELGEGRSWEESALGVERLDADGPALMFAIEPGSETPGRSFIRDLAESRTIELSREGTKLASMPTQGARDALLGLAGCIMRIRNVGSADVERETAAPPPGSVTI